MLAWFFRGSGPVLLKKLYLCDFSGGSEPPPPPLDPPMSLSRIERVQSKSILSYQNLRYQESIEHTKLVRSKKVLMFNFACFVILQSYCFQKFFLEYHQTAKHFRSRSGPTFSRGLIWVQNINNGYQQMSVHFRTQGVLI